VAPDTKQQRGIPRWVKILFLCILIAVVLVFLTSCNEPEQDTLVSGPPITTSTTTTYDFRGVVPLTAPAPTTTVTTQPPTTTTMVAVSITTVPPPTTQAPPTSQPSVAADGDVWWELAGCETGYKYDNPNTGNGYFGYFQFSLPTWQSVGGPGYPHEHSYETQKEYAQKLQARSGWGQWPHCSKVLRQKGYIR
jgi:hypothetical protein